MKKIFLGVLALSLFSGAAIANGGGKKKAKKAKTESKKDCCKSNKDCSKTCTQYPACCQ